MRSGKLKLITILVGLLTLAALISGCTQSKKSYQNNLTKILTDTKTELDKVAPPIISKSKSNQKSRDKKELDILKKTRKRLQAINPPDDFYSGHANLIQFLDLYIQGKELANKDAAKKSSKKPVFPPNQSKSAQMMMMANRSLSQSAQELSFMQYNLLETFGQLARSVPQPGPRPIRPQTR